MKAFIYLSAIFEWLDPR